ELDCELPGERRERGLHLLRLHRQHEHVAAKRRGIEAGHRAHAEAALERGTRRVAEFDHLDVAGCKAAFDHAADEGRGHVAAAEKSDLHELTCRMSLAHAAAWVRRMEWKRA